MRTVLFMLFSCFALIFISCGDKQPSLANVQMQWKTYNRNIDADDPNFPLEIREDGYKMIRAYVTPAAKIKGTELPRAKEVEWGGRLTVCNKSGKVLGVEVEYILQDKDGFQVASDTESEYIGPNKTVTIQSTSTMNYDNAERVTSSTWKIGRW